MGEVWSGGLNQNTCLQVQKSHKKSHELIPMIALKGYKKRIRDAINFV